jgi:hypothetical protein
MVKRIVIDIENEARILPKYLYYLLLNKKDMIEQLYVGTAQKFLHLSTMNYILSTAGIPAKARYNRKDESLVGKICIQPVGGFNIYIGEE